MTLEREKLLIINHILNDKVLCPIKIYLLVGWIAEKLLNGFPGKLDGEWEAQNKPSELLVEIRGRIPGFFLSLTFFRIVR